MSRSRQYLPHGGGMELGRSQVLEAEWAGGWKEAEVLAWAQI